MSTVLQQDPPRTIPIHEVQRAIPVVTFYEVEYGYAAGMSLGYSVIVHQVLLLAILVFGRYAFLHSHLMFKPRLAPRSTDILILPSLGGGSEGSGQTGGAEGSTGKLSVGLRARSQQGFAYPGPQPLVSNPPQAAPGIETILQPSMENLPTLRRYVPLPNIVQPPPASGDIGHQDRVLVVKSGTKSSPRAMEAPAEPKITLPNEGNIFKLVQVQPHMPEKAVPDPMQSSDVSGVTTDKKGLLVLNAVPPPPDVAGKIPWGEARAQFAVLPAETAVMAVPVAGTTSGGVSSTSAGVGNRSDIIPGDAVAEIAAGGGTTNIRQADAGAGSGSHYGNGQGAGVNYGGNRAGIGKGEASGSGLGSGSASSKGSGNGASSAPGGGSFPGITIRGGRYGSGTAENMVGKASSPRQKSYNMTIVSTGSSGGGLPELGVFQNEKVYTVYLDVRADDKDVAPSWTLQYAVIQPASDDHKGTTNQIVGTPTPPYAMLKEIPEFAPEVVRRCGRRLIVISGTLNAAGKLDELLVRESPDNEVVAPLLEALKHWMFEPAQVDSRPVALKVLLGIRLASLR